MKNLLLGRIYLDTIEEQFGEVYNDIFINDLKYVIERYINKMDYASYAELENLVTAYIEDENL